MQKLGKLMLLAIGLGTSSVALAGWEYAEILSEHPGNGSYSICVYETAASGYRFTLQLRYCPSSVQVNTETGMVRK